MVGWRREVDPGPIPPSKSLESSVRSLAEAADLLLEPISPVAKSNRESDRGLIVSIVAPGGGKVSRPSDDKIRYSQEFMDRIEAIRMAVGRILKELAVENAKGEGRSLLTAEDASVAAEILFGEESDHDAKTD